MQPPELQQVNIAGTTREIAQPAIFGGCRLNHAEVSKAVPCRCFIREGAA